MTIQRAATAGATYFVIVFGIGFVLGTIRAIFMMRFPEISRFAAVAVEGPIILTASWITCGFLVRKFTIANRWQDRAIMGGIAFALLMIAETTTSSLLFGQSIAEQVAQYREPAYALGLAGQMLFGVIPLLVGRH